MKIWLDDIRPAPEGWLHVKTFQAAEIALLAHAGEVEEISLDHDLGDDEEYGTGYDVVRWIEEAAHEAHVDHNDNPFHWNLVPKVITIHSANPVGRKNMQAAIDSIERMRNA